MAVWQGQFITIIIISKELSNQSNGNVSVQEECRERVWRNSYFKKQACVNMSDGLALYEQLTPPSSTFLRETIVSLLVCDKHIDTAAHIQPQTEVQPPDISIFSQKHTHTHKLLTTHQLLYNDIKSISYVSICLLNLNLIVDRSQKTVM